MTLSLTGTRKTHTLTTIESINLRLMMIKIDFGSDLYIEHCYQSRHSLSGYMPEPGLQLKVSRNSCELERVPSNRIFPGQCESSSAHLMERTV